MGENFQMMPMSLRIAQGDTAVLKCSPPKANPKPSITWVKNGATLSQMDSKRFHISDSGIVIYINIHILDFLGASHPSSVSI